MLYAQLCVNKTFFFFPETVTFLYWCNVIINFFFPFFYDFLAHEAFFLFVLFQFTECVFREHQRAFSREIPDNQVTGFFSVSACFQLPKNRVKLLKRSAHILAGGGRPPSGPTTILLDCNILNKKKKGRFSTGGSQLCCGFSDGIQTPQNSLIKTHTCFTVTSECKEITNRDIAGVSCYSA